jgi:DNA adenine methylase
MSYSDIIPLVESRRGDRKVFFFLDPPYYPISTTSSFTSYDKNAWKKEDFVKLKEFVGTIDKKGWLFLLCNHSVPFINDLFWKYNSIEHSISRSVSCKANDRNPVMEILVANYDIKTKQKKVSTL